MHTPHGSVDIFRAEYPDLLKKCLMRALFPELHLPAGRVTLPRYSPLCGALHPLSQPLLRPFGLQLNAAYRKESRSSGLNWPAEAGIVIGPARLDHRHPCAVSVVQERIQGRFVETGPCRMECAS